MDSAFRPASRERPAGDWSDVATAMKSEIILSPHARAKELEFRVIAISRRAR